MTGDDLTERLRLTFMQELEEQVGELNTGLLALEQHPDDEERIRSLFRSAHTIKGAARVAGVPAVEQICHAMESVFANIRDGRQSLTGSDFSLLFATCDALQEAAERLRARQELGGSSVHALLPRLETMAERAAPRGATPYTAQAGPQTRKAPDAISDQVASRAGPPPGDTPAAAAEPSHSAGRGASSVTAAQEHRADRGVASESDTQPEATTGETDQTNDPGVAGAGDADTGGELVRVSAERLDALLSAVGELIIATGRIVERSPRDDEDARRLDGATDNVADVVRRLRLRSFGAVCEGLPRAARDVAAAEDKEVELSIEGADVEADRMVMDALRDPLLHIVRNAVDHGIETPDARERAGKPRKGLVRVAAELTGGRLVVSVSDDGAGLDEATIRRTLRERGREAPGNSTELAEALLAGGFSTREHATAISGRGVGLDIVRSSLDRIGGTVDIDWVAGRGTTFLLECPPTPATLRAVLIRLGSYLYAIPTAHVQRLRRVRADELRSAAGGTMLPTGSGPIRILSLARLLGPPLEARPLDDIANVVEISVGSRRAGLIVDEIIDEDEIVIRPLVAQEGAVPHAAGAAILPSGRVALVLAAGSLLAAGLRPGTAIAPASGSAVDARRRRILVADDSITTRTLEQSVLESAGYQVFTAVNGEDAWETLEREGADALVADVEMPRMDGFALCRRVRASERFRELPIVLVTGLDSPEDRARGLEAGADMYLVKSSFDQASLLNAVHQLIGET